MLVVCPEVLNQGAIVPSHQGKEVWKEKRCPRGWRRVYSIGSETRRRVCPHTRETQDIGHTTVAVETLKATTRVPALERQNLLSKNIITKEHPREEWKHCHKVKAAAKTERWAMPTWCHMFNSTLIGNVKVWFDDLPQESIDSYDDLKNAFLENYLQQKKCIKIRLKFAISSREMGSPRKNLCREERWRPLIVNGRSHFPHGNNKKPNKRKTKKGGFRTQQRLEQKHDRFTLLTKTPKEILALDKGKFKPPPPMTTPVEKRNASKFCEFQGEVEHTTNECMHLKRQIEEMLKAGKLSHLIKEMKQNSGKDQPKTSKKGEASNKDKPLEILMVQPWQRIARQRIT
ncbi:hypothetical protein Tco_1467377 [Tanacetum coccineum]